MFSALLSLLVFRRRLFLFQTLGLCVLVVALIVVSSSGVASHVTRRPDTCAGNEDREDLQDRELQGILGIAFVLAGQFVSAGQYTLEEVLRCDAHVHPLLLVSLQGFWGLMSLIVIVPLLNLTQPCHGDNDMCHLSVFWHEDAISTYEALESSPHLLSLSAVYAFAVVMWNMFGVRATRFLGTSKRTFVEISRILLVWAADIALFYLGGLAYHRVRGETAAEPWREWSWVQMIGFGLLIIGILIFNHVIKLPGLWYPSKWSMAEWAERGAIVGEVLRVPGVRGL